MHFKWSLWKNWKLNNQVCSFYVEQNNLVYICSIITCPYPSHTFFSSQLIFLPTSLSSIFSLSIIVLNHPNIFSHLPLQLIINHNIDSLIFSSVTASTSAHLLCNFTIYFLLKWLSSTYATFLISYEFLQSFIYTIAFQHFKFLSPPVNFYNNSSHLLILSLTHVNLTLCEIYS